MSATYYDLLGVAHDATDQDIKRAYRKLAMQWHPDLNAGDKDAESHFKRVAEAYEVLSQPEARKRYDQQLAFSHFKSQGASGSTTFEFEFSSFGDMLSELFTGAWKRASRQNGRDVSYTVEIDLQHVLHGVETTAEILQEVDCRGCTGSGRVGGKTSSMCSRCEGSGQVQFETGIFNVHRTCPDCGGAGYIVGRACPLCDGVGKRRDLAEMRVLVPPGVTEGFRIRHHGLGEPGQGGGSAGDLYFVVKIRAHPLFTRQAEHIHCQVPVSFAELALGAEIEVPTLEGKVLMRIPPGTQTGKQFRLRGRGLPEIGAVERGDQIVELVAETPTDLSDEAADLLRAFGGVLQADSEPERQRFYARVQELFGATEDPET